MNDASNYEDDEADCTAVLAMTKDFEQLLSSGSTQAPLSRFLNFGDHSQPNIPKNTTRLASVPKQKSSLSVKTVLEKEKEQQSIRIQLEKAENGISTLKEKNEILEAQMKKMRLQHESEKDECFRKEQAILSSLLEVKKMTDDIMSTSVTATSTNPNDVLDAIKGDLTQIQASIKRNNTLVKLTHRKLSLITKERDALLSVISAYESELDKDIEGATVDHPECKAQLTRVQAELDETNKQLATRKPDESIVNQSRKTSCSQEMEDLRSEMADLKEQLEEKVEQLKMHEDRRHLQGHYDPSTTKVIHLCDNPADLAKKKNASLVQELSAKNERLSERLAIVQHQGSVPNLSMMVDEKLGEGRSQDIQDLKERLQKAEMKNTRLQEAFKSTSQEFRSMVYQLLGYRINITGNHQYQLMSMYAETQHDILCFTTASNGDVEILANAYSMSFEDDCEHYLRTGNSLPAFLSSITLELFNRQTILS